MNAGTCPGQLPDTDRHRDGFQWRGVTHRSPRCESIVNVQLFSSTTFLDYAKKEILNLAVRRAEPCSSCGSHIILAMEIHSKFRETIAVDDYTRADVLCVEPGVLEIHPSS